MTIVVGTDFSAAAFRAADAAAAIAKGRGAPLVIAHFAGKEASAGDEARMRSEVTRLEDVCPTRAWFEEGAPRPERFAALARDLRAELLVVGAGDGRARLPGGLGSVAAGVVEHLSDVPVLAVRAPELLRASPKVLALLALDETDEGVLGALAFLAGGGLRDVDVLHFAALPHDEPERHQATQVVERALRERLQGVDARPQHVVVRDSARGIERALDEVIGSSGAALVVCGSHHRRAAARLWHGSVAERVLAHSPVSVLVAPAPPVRP